MRPPRIPATAPTVLTTVLHSDRNISDTLNRKNHSLQYTGFPLYFDIKIQGLSRTLKLHFQGPILDGSLQHGQ